MSPKPAEPTLSNRAWCRVVQYAGPKTNWVTAHALRLQGDGPFISASGAVEGDVLVFYRLADLIEWAKKNGISHLEF